MYRYETHLHTYPVSHCAVAGVKKSIEFYREIGYDGIFITNHFLDGNINTSGNMSYEESIEFYFSDYEKGKKLGEEIGIKVFCGVEMSYKGTDFLVYGLDKAWYLSHPQIMNMKKSDEMLYLMENGALIIQAHPFREAGYIDHIRLFPRCVHGIEVINACRSEPENKMAERYAEHYNLIRFAGSDNHTGASQRKLAGMCSDEPVGSEREFIERVLSGKMQVFCCENKKQNSF